MISVGDVTLAYHEYGSGYPVIFINGLASAMDTWNPPVIGKISRHFRVIVFDNRGTDSRAFRMSRFRSPSLRKTPLTCWMLLVLPALMSSGSPWGRASRRNWRSHSRRSRSAHPCCRGRRGCRSSKSIAGYFRPAYRQERDDGRSGSSDVFSAFPSRMA